MQKYYRGDLVQIAKDLDPMRGHFTADARAIILYSYSDKYYGRGSSSGYALHIENKGFSAWYDEIHLALIEAGRFDLLEKWQNEKKDKEKKESNLEWIFQQEYDFEGLKVLPSGSSLNALAACLNINLWGERGEGFNYYLNSMKLLSLAGPYLQTHNLAGWIKACNKSRNERGLPLIDKTFDAYIQYKHDKYEDL